MRWLPALALIAMGCDSSDPAPAVRTKAELGQALFEDTRLSEPAGQACTECHQASAAFSDPEEERTSPGAIRDRFGSRNSQSAMYARFTPPLHEKNGQMFGGLMWDGRAANLAEQAALPLLNPLEMNNPDKATVVRKVRQHYGSAFQRLYGKDIFADTDKAFAAVGDAFAAFQSAPEFSPFSSRYDRFLAGTATLSDAEQRGLAAFEDPARGNCASCHPSRPAADGTPPMFTTFGYANLSIPEYRDNPFYAMSADLNPDGEKFVDRGLATTTRNPAHEGMFRTPSLRNVVRTTPYGHNGYFRRLDEMIEHIDKQDDSIHLSRRDVTDIVAFLQTLTDASVDGAR